jgi:thiopurine S-methyltransferase
LLRSHIGVLGVSQRVFVPLAGRSADMAFLAAQGHEVVAVELVADALLQFASDMGLEGQLQHECLGEFSIYKSAPYTLIVGDFFALTPPMLGGAQVYYDRAALVALPPEVRGRYFEKLRELLPPQAVGLVMTFASEQALSKGPPFLVPESELRAAMSRVTHLSDGSAELRPGEVLPRHARAFRVELPA